MEIAARLDGTRMELRLATADYSFPKLRWEQTLRLARDLGMRAMDIGLFAGRSHLDPGDVLSNIGAAAARIRAGLEANSLEIADVFGQPGKVFEEKAVNHPDSAVREQSAEFFHRTLELAVGLKAKHMTLLPGARFASESYEASLGRAAEELAWRVEAAAKMGVVLAVEAHIGSIVPTPAEAQRLVRLAPGLTLTLDYTHFTYQGISDDDVEPLLACASHFHARGACRGKLQACFAENTIDYARVLRAMQRLSYRGYVVLEYVWVDWMGCNQVDNVSETVLLRDLLESAAGAM